MIWCVVILFLAHGVGMGAGGTAAGIWEARNYERYSGLASTVTAAATTVLDGSLDQVVTISGSTTITAFTLTTEGSVRRCKLSGAPKITYNATSLITPGAADIQGAANDTFDVRSLGSGNVQISNYIRAAVSPLIANVYTANVRLTLTSGTPVTTSDVTAAETVYATPFRGNQLPLYNGTEMKSYPFSELSIKSRDTQTGTTTNGSAVITGLTDTSQFVRGMALTGVGVNSGHNIASIDSATQVTLDANATASGTVPITFLLVFRTCWDVFATIVNGSIVLRYGRAWTTARATDPISTLSGTGIYVNTNAVASGDYNSIAAGQGTYLGTILPAESADGRVDDSVRERGVFNAFNRVPRPFVAIETTDSWTYSTAAYQGANGNTNNAALVNIVVGLSEEPVRVNVRAAASTNGATSRTVRAGIGIDSPTVNSASTFDAVNLTNVSPALKTLGATYVGFPGIGYHYLLWLEYGGGADTQTWFGDGGGVRQCGMTGEAMG